MWGRLYLALVLLRLYVALCPSYLHPDEHFQGPEIIAGEVFGYPIYKTWEFSSSHPIRSVFPIWIVYGWPLRVLEWLWEGLGYGPVPPSIAFYSLRVIMFLLSFVLGDWAIHELVSAQRERWSAIMLVASSYVTWTFQTHTFSNSIETLVVLWSLVLILRLRDNTQQTVSSACVALAFIGVLGVFNRITFPAYVVAPLVQLLPGLYRKPLRLPIMLGVGLFTAVIAITVDTLFYAKTRPRLREIHRAAVIAPWNNLAYNLDETNLAEHGLHPFWQHFLINLPQMIGPALPLALVSSKKNTLFWAAIVGTTLLSCFRHQEPRFLLPAVPLLLSCIRVPRPAARYWVAAWVLFNVLGGIIFGTYHQGGIVPAQMWISRQENVGHAFWWKTYSPPRWLLDGKSNQIATTDLMGLPGLQMIELLRQSSQCDGENKTLLVAPSSANFLDEYIGASSPHRDLIFHHLWRHGKHIGLDDLDFGYDGVWPTLERVIGRRGLDAWQVSKKC